MARNVDVLELTPFPIGRGIRSVSPNGLYASAKLSDVDSVEPGMIACHRRMLPVVSV